MSKNFIEDKTFGKTDFTSTPLPKGDYERCEFLGCNFSSADLTGINFSECVFKDSDFSLAKISKMALKDIQFKGCKLLGFPFEKCETFLFAVAFENCVLNLSSFYKLNLKKTTFKNCSLKEADFTECNLTEALFLNCDLAGTRFERTILEKADFRSSYNYSLDPELNRIKKARFSHDGISGLLHKYDIVVE